MIKEQHYLDIFSCFIILFLYLFGTFYPAGYNLNSTQWVLQCSRMLKYSIKFVISCVLVPFNVMPFLHGILACYTWQGTAVLLSSTVFDAIKN
jgi:hypothetical protein